MYPEMTAKLFVPLFLALCLTAGEYAPGSAGIAVHRDFTSRDVMHQQCPAATRAGADCEGVAHNGSHFFWMGHFYGHALRHKFMIACFVTYGFRGPYAARSRIVPCLPGGRG